MSQNCFTISQAYLGSPLRFEPALGSKELDRLVDSFVHGHATLQQKRAQVSLEFFNAIELSNLPHPVSRRYHVPHHVNASPSTTSLGFSSPESSASPATSKSLKRARPSSTKDSSSKRLPGFSIMTRDGVDITEYASRGPKSKEQRDHAALMRKLKACGPCKRSKQRCDPSHHRVAASPATTPSSATPSLTSGYSWSQASISPQSVIEDSFSRSSNQKARTIAHAGSEFSSPFFESPKLAFSPADLTFNDSLDMAFNDSLDVASNDSLDMAFDSLPLQNVDPTFFQMADMDLIFSASANVQPLNLTHWAMWDVHTTNVQSFSQSLTSAGRLDESSPSCLESWDSQRNPQSPPASLQLRQYTQSIRDVSADVDFDVDQLVQYSPHRATGLELQVSSDKIPGVSPITATSSALCAQTRDYVQHYREIVLTQYLMYTAMTLLVIGSMNFYPQWSLATILVLLKALHSWPNLMSTKHSALEYFSSREDFQEVTSQGIPEENCTCYISSSSSVLPSLQQSGSACSSVATPQHETLYPQPITSRIESLNSLVSMLSRFFDQSKSSRRISALRV